MGAQRTWVPLGSGMSRLAGGLRSDDGFERTRGLMGIELLYFEGCPNHETLLPHLREMLAREGIDTEVELRRVEDLEAAERERFLGSPTLRIDGITVGGTA